MEHSYSLVINLLVLRHLGVDMMWLRFSGLPKCLKAMAVSRRIQIKSLYHARSDTTRRFSITKSFP